MVEIGGLVAGKPPLKRVVVGVAEHGGPREHCERVPADDGLPGLQCLSIVLGLPGCDRAIHQCHHVAEVVAVQVGSGS